MHFYGINILVILPLLIGALNLFTPFINKEDSRIRNFFLIGVSCVFLFNIFILDYLFLGGIRPNFILANYGKFSIAFHIEPLGIIFLNLLSVLWPAALLYTIKYLDLAKIDDSGRFLFFVNCCILAGSLIALSADLFTMFIFYEILTLCTIPLIIHSQNDESIQGLFKYLKILMISSLVLFLPAILYIYNISGKVCFTHGGFIENYCDEFTARILFLTFIFGIAKAAIYPLHGWLPAAMVASYPVSALLHAVVVVKAGLFCIFKIILYVFGLNYLQKIFTGYNFLIIFPIITIIYSSFRAICCDKIKTILAYSTINQLNIALMSALLLSPKGISAAIIHMISHSLTKICLFYAAGNIYILKGSYKISDLAGMAKFAPKSALFILLAGLSLIGIPPFAGFISKFYILIAAVEQKNYSVIGVILVSSIFSALYISKILVFLYKRHVAEDLVLKDNGSDKYPEKKLSSFMIIAIIIPLIGTIGFFFVLQLLNKFLPLILYDL